MKRMFVKSLLMSLLMLLLAISGSLHAAGVKVSKRMYGKTKTGEKVHEYTLKNKNDITVRLITYGATMTSLVTPDRDGNLADIVLGYDDISGYESDPIFSGCIVGRFANRISNASFELEGKKYELAQNFQGGHHLHGGEVGFNARIWNSKIIKQSNGSGVAFTLVSPDGEEGYPGRLEVRVKYLLNDNNDLTIDYWASTDKTTHINLTQHSYYNLAGHDSGNVHGHFVRLYCDHYLPVDEHGVPTGEIKSVEGTEFDFRDGARIDRKVGDGRYDHNYVLATQRPEKPILLARVSEGTSGRGMAVRTDQPGVQFYTSIHMKETPGKNGAVYNTNQALCLETQHFPDTPNKPNFPTTVLTAGEEFRSRTIHHFYTWQPRN
ncbi:MAG: galactose-1-epimerase [Planctomycetaceae bacterium]|nr:galactose-1-epimerase [Planctomycetaceae bacterium]